MNDQDVGKRLRTLRERAKLGQQEVAAAIGVSRPMVSQWESGRSGPSRENLRALAVFFRISIDELLGRPDTQDTIRVSSPEEKELIQLMRSVPTDVRQAVLTLLRAAGKSPR